MKASGVEELQNNHSHKEDCPCTLHFVRSTQVADPATTSPLTARGHFKLPHLGWYALMLKYTAYLTVAHEWGAKGFQQHQQKEHQAPQPDVLG